MYATGTVAPGSFGPHAGTGHGGSGRSGPMQVPGTVAETAPRPPSSGMAVSSTGWGGGEAAVGAAGQLPALLVDGCTTRVARPTSRGWLGAPPRVGGSRAMAARSRP